MGDNSKHTIPVGATSRDETLGVTFTVVAHAGSDEHGRLYEVDSDDGFGIVKMYEQAMIGFSI